MPHSPALCVRRLGTLHGHRSLSSDLTLPYDNTVKWSRFGCSIANSRGLVPQRADRWWLSARLVHSGAVQPRLQVCEVRGVAEALEVLEERAGDPGRGCRGADGQESLSFLIESAREWFGGAEIDRALQLSDRDRVAGRQPGGGGLGFGEQLVFRDHAVHQAEAVRLGHIDRCSFEGQLERLRRAEHPCQSLSSAAPGNEAAQCLDLAEPYMLGIRCIAQVAGQRNLVPAANCGTVDGGNIDRPGPVHPQRRPLPAMKPDQAYAETATKPL